VSILLEFSMSPLGEGEGVSKQVSGSLEIIAASGLPYRLGPMGTTIEGEWDEVMGVMKDCYVKMSESCKRISCVAKIDAREATQGRLNGKTDKLEALLGKKLQQ